MIPMVEQYEQCHWLDAYYGQECELCPYREECENKEEKDDVLSDM